MQSREKVSTMSWQNRSSLKWSSIDIRPFHCKCHQEKVYVLRTQTLKNDEYILSNIKNQKIWKKRFYQKTNFKVVDCSMKSIEQTF